MKSVDIELPVELEGFTADVAVSYVVDGKVNRDACIESISGFVRFNGERVHLEGNFDLSELAALMYFLDEGE